MIQLYQDTSLCRHSILHVYLSPPAPTCNIVARSRECIPPTSLTALRVRPSIPRQSTLPLLTLVSQASSSCLVYLNIAPAHPRIYAPKSGTRPFHFLYTEINPFSVPIYIKAPSPPFSLSPSVLAGASDRHLDDRHQDQRQRQGHQQQQDCNIMDYKSATDLAFGDARCFRFQRNSPIT